MSKSNIVDFAPIHPQRPPAPLTSSCSALILILDFHIFRFSYFLIFIFSFFFDYQILDFQISDLPSDYQISFIF